MSTTITPQLESIDLLQKYFYDAVYVNSCPLFPVPCSLFPTSARSLIEGIVERITFHSDESRYTVARFKVPRTPDLVTIIGNFAQIEAGQALKLSGIWRDHPKFGQQFQVTQYRETKPVTLTGMETQKAIKEVMVFLQGHGVSITYSVQPLFLIEPKLTTKSKVTWEPRPGFMSRSTITNFPHSLRSHSYCEKLVVQLGKKSGLLVDSDATVERNF